MKHTEMSHGVPLDLVQDSPESIHDEILIERTTQGDDSAFAEIVRRYHGRIFGYVNSLLRNAADAEEIAQDTFIRAYRGMDTFRGESSLPTWLYRIALSLSRNHYWFFFRRRRQDSISLNLRFSNDSQTTLGDHLAATSHGPAQAAIASEFVRLLDLCMEKLEPSHREILVLRNILDLPYRQIANELRIGIGTVKSRIKRARQQLREALALEAPDFGAGCSPRDFLTESREPAFCANGSK